MPGKGVSAQGNVLMMLRGLSSKIGRLSDFIKGDGILSGLENELEMRPDEGRGLLLIRRQRLLRTSKIS